MTSRIACSSINQQQDNVRLEPQIAADFALAAPLSFKRSSASSTMYMLSRDIKTYQHLGSIQAWPQTSQDQFYAGTVGSGYSLIIGIEARDTLKHILQRRDLKSQQNRSGSISIGDVREGRASLPLNSVREAY